MQKREEQPRHGRTVTVQWPVGNLQRHPQKSIGVPDDWSLEGCAAHPPGAGQGASWQAADTAERQSPALRRGREQPSSARFTGLSLQGDGCVPALPLGGGERKGAGDARLAIVSLLLHFNRGLGDISFQG